MKIDRVASTHEQKSTRAPGPRFAERLRAPCPLTAHATARATVPPTRAVEAQPACRDGPEASTSGGERDRDTARALELIASELACPPASAPLPGAATPGAPQPQPIPAEAAVHAPEVASALELVQRIELFLRSQRPALALTLTGRLAGEVRVEKTGPRQVALHLRRRGGRLREEDLSELKAQLSARGLRLSRLLVG